MSDEFDWQPFLGSGGEERERHPIVKWDEKGKSVVGQITEVWSFKKDDKITPVLTVTTDDGTVSVFASQVDLRSKLAERDPQVGDRVGIRYDGVEELPETGRTMKRFSVKVEKPVTDDEEEPF